MPCYHPTEINLRRLNPDEDSHFKYQDLGPQVVPCGSCIGCRAEQGRQWAVRMMHEARMHQSSWFVTLTYNDERIPEDGTLFPKDLSGFVKSLRKEQESPLSFFGCGEYGERTQRPHYHAVLFGVEFLDKYRCTGFDGRSYWRSQTLESVWGRGNCEFGAVTMASASYVAGYVRKKVKAKHYSRVSPDGVLLEPEFSRMSLRPPVGQRWIKKHWEDVYPRDYVVVDGVEAKPPRYYDKYMDFPDEKGGSAERRDCMEHVRTQRYLDAIDLTDYQLKAGEKIHQSRVELFQGRDAL